MTINRLHRLLTGKLVFMLAFLAGCGFQLRGEGILPEALQAVRLDCRPIDAQLLCNEIRRQLSAQEITVAEADSVKDGSDKQSADLTTQLVISSIDDNRRAASIARDASIAEIEFSRTVDFIVMSPDLQDQGVEMTATQFQTYQYTELSVLGKEKEEQQVKDNLNRLLANEILNRAASVLALTDQ